MTASNLKETVVHKHTRSCTPPRASVRVWEIVWEVNGNLFHCEVTVSVFMTAPELICAKANIPSGCPRILSPKL